MYDAPASKDCCACVLRFFCSRAARCGDAMIDDRCGDFTRLVNSSRVVLRIGRPRNYLAASRTTSCDDIQFY